MCVCVCVCGVCAPARGRSVVYDRGQAVTTIAGGGGGGGGHRGGDDDDGDGPPSMLPLEVPIPPAQRGAATRRPLSRFDKRGDLRNEGSRSISGGCKSGLASNCTCVGANSTANGTANGSSSDQDGVKLSMEQAGLAVGKLKMALA